MKKNFTIILAALLVYASGILNVRAAEDFSFSVNGVGYSSIDSAINAVSEEGEIVLNKDYIANETVKINIAKKFSINMNGYSITCSSVYGTLNVLRGDVTIYDNIGTSTIENTAFESGYAKTIYVYRKYNTYGSKLVINNVNIIGNFYGIYLGKYANVYLNNTNIDAVYGFTLGNNTTLNIDGGNYNSTKNTIFGLDAENVEETNISIKSGNFTSNEDQFVLSDNILNKQSNFISGGTYNKDISDYILEDYKVIQKDGTYIVVSTNYNENQEDENTDSQTNSETDSTEFDDNNTEELDALTEEIEKEKKQLEDLEKELNDKEKTLKEKEIELEEKDKELNDKEAYLKTFENNLEEEANRLRRLELELENEKNNIKNQNENFCSNKFLDNKRVFNDYSNIDLSDDSLGIKIEYNYLDKEVNRINFNEIKDKYNVEYLLNIDCLLYNKSNLRIVDSLKEVNKKIPVRIKLPETFNYNEDIYIAKYHNNKVDLIKPFSIDGNYITFETSQFSIFAIVTPIKEENNLIATSTDSIKLVKEYNDKTFIINIISLFAFALFIIFSKRKNHA